MMYLGTNIYCSDAEQRRLLLHGLRPWTLSARQNGLMDFFTYRRFDARGPHVCAIFRGPTGLREFLEAHVREFLRDCPPGNMKAEEVRRRHRQCRGRSLCAVDQESSFADNNSFVFFDPTPQDYPLSFVEGTTDAQEFRRCLDVLTAWSLERIENGAGNSAAVHWLAALNQSFTRYGVDSRAYWHFHSQKLLPILEQRAADLEAARYWLQLAVSEENRRLFSPIWDRTMAETDSRLAEADGVVHAVVGDDSRTVEERFRILHEVSDLVLHQLYLPTSIQTVMVLYAWERSLLNIDDSEPNSLPPSRQRTSPSSEVR